MSEAKVRSRLGFRVRGVAVTGRMLALTTLVLLAEAVIIYLALA